MSTDFSSWRIHPLKTDGYLFIHKRQPVFRAQISGQSAFPNNFGQVNFGSVSFGSLSAVLPDQTVSFGSTVDANDLGETRIRAGSSGTLLNIQWSSLGNNVGEVNVQANGVYITVWDEYKDWAISPRIFPVSIPIPLPDGYVEPAAVTYKDYDLSAPTYIPPVANGGSGYGIDYPAYISTFDGTTPVAKVNFIGANSFAVHSGASITGYAWNLRDGYPSTSTSSNPTAVEFPAGFRYVHLTVTDSNSQTHICHVPVYVASGPSDSTLITRANIKSLVQTQTGTTLTADIFQTLPESQYPSGCLVMYWEKEYYDGVLLTLTETTNSFKNRDHMRFVGWHKGETISLARQSKYLQSIYTITAIDAGERLQVLAAYPQIVTVPGIVGGTGATNDWTVLPSPTPVNPDTIAHYIGHWHSTTFKVTDFIWSGVGSNFPNPILEPTGNSLYQQINFCALAMDYITTSDRFGAIRLVPDPILQDPADRTSVIQADIGPSDMVSVHYAHNFQPKNHWLRGSAIQASTTSDPSTLKPLFTVAPGSAPGQGPGEATSSQRLAIDQNNLDKRDGQRAGRENSTFDKFEIELANSGNVGLDPGLCQWIQVSLDSTVSGYRDQEFTNQRFLLHEVNTSYDYKKRQKIVRIIVEREINSPPAETFVQAQSNLQPYVPPSVQLRTPPPEVLVPPEDSFIPGRVVIAGRDGTIVRATGYNTGSPSFTNITPSYFGTYNVYPSGVHVVSVIYDYWRPTRVLVLFQIRSLITGAPLSSTASGIISTEDAWAVSVTWTYHSNTNSTLVNTVPHNTYTIIHNPTWDNGAGYTPPTVGDITYHSVAGDGYLGRQIFYDPNYLSPIDHNLGVNPALAASINRKNYFCWFIHIQDTYQWKSDVYYYPGTTNGTITYPPETYTYEDFVLNYVDVTTYFCFTTDNFNTVQMSLVPIGPAHDNRIYANQRRSGNSFFPYAAYRANQSYALQIEMGKWNNPTGRGNAYLRVFHDSFGYDPNNLNATGEIDIPVETVAEEVHVTQDWGRTWAIANTYIDPNLGSPFIISDTLNLITPIKVAGNTNNKANLTYASLARNFISLAGGSVVIEGSGSFTIDITGILSLPANGNKMFACYTYYGTSGMGTALGTYFGRPSNDGGITWGSEVSFSSSVASGRTFTGYSINPIRFIQWPTNSNTLFSYGFQALGWSGNRGTSWNDQYSNYSTYVIGINGSLGRAEEIVGLILDTSTAFVPPVTFSGP